MVLERGLRLAAGTPILYENGWRSSCEAEMNILYIEDDPKTAAFVRKGLSESGHTLDQASDGQAGLVSLLSGSHDIAIVDVMLPELDGIDVVRRARAAGVEIPVLFLSARTAVEHRVSGLRSGGDDYMTKPFAFSELLARLEAIHRRASGKAAERFLRVGDVELDTQRRRASRAGRTIDLQPLEFALLEYLLRNAGLVVTKTMIAEQVWGYNFDPRTNVVESRICRLREKIDRPFDSALIRTVRGCGYVFEEA